MFDPFLFFPVIVLLALVLIVLSVKVLFRLLIFFLVILAGWYALSLVGVVSSPKETFKEYRAVPKQAQKLALLRAKTA